MASRPTLRTIPPGAPFLDTLVEALLRGTLVPGFDPSGDPLKLASVTLFLPTQRAIRVVRDVVLRQVGSDAVLLPRLMALGEVDEDDLAFDPAAGLLPVDDAIGPLARQLGLTRLILGWSRSLRGALLPLDGEDEPLLIPSSTGDAAALAAELARFIDGMQIDGVPGTALAALAAEAAGRHDKYWELTARFLAIATSAWPLHLREQGLSDPVERHNRLVAAEVARIASGRLPGPVIVAGSTGSVPSTRDLIAAVAAAPLGAVVLPGLDLDLDEAGWAAISNPEGSSGHPQAALKRLLDHLGVLRDAVLPLGTVPAGMAGRARFVSQALRPASTTEAWAGLAANGDDAVAAFDGVAIVEAAGECEEAVAVALALRQVLEDPGRTAALVTPDRGLAARVVAELDRWGVAADDSAGRPLATTPPGIFARLVLDVALSDFAAVPVLALAKHPFASLGLGRAEVRRAIEALEIGGLRGPRPPPGPAGLRTALAAGLAGLASPHAPASRRRLSPDDWQAAHGLVDRIEAAIGPFAALMRVREPQSASALFAAHMAAVEAAAEGEDRLFALDAGQMFRAFVDDLATGGDDLDLPSIEYPGLFAALMGGRSVRGGEPRHPRIAIYGLLEARLMSVDRLVLGGLDEGIWPPEARADPWLNRPMRAAVGLSPPEKRIGLAAHDFEQALGAAEVIVTRALKRAGSPTVSSRWVQRLAASAPPAFAAMLARGTVWRDLARGLDAPRGPVIAAAAPRPRPPLALRPTRLSVTRIETLVRDPYTLYASHILALDPLDELAAAPDASDRGTLVHEAVRRFADACSAGMPADPAGAFLAIADRLLADFAAFPDVATFWRPRFLRIAAFLPDWEAGRRPLLADIRTEMAGRLTWPTVAGRVFTLSATADRIETRHGGTVCVIDFKTGAVPTARQIQSGMSPQLALEAAMAMASAFPGLSTTGLVLGDLLLVKLGAGQDGCREIPILFKDSSTADIAAHSLARLKGLIDRFEDEATPYASRIHPMFTRRHRGDYDHLARVREWSLAIEDGGEAGEE